MSSAIKTLIILSPGFPKNEADMNCMPFPQLFVRRLKELNPALNIIVLAFQYPFKKDEYDWHNVKVIAFGGTNRGKMHRLLLWRKVSRRMKQIIKITDAPGILNLWLGEAALVGHYMAKKHGLPVFTWLLGQDAKAGNRYFSGIKPTENELVALSDSVADELYKNYGLLPAHVIPPGVEIIREHSSPVLRDFDVAGVGSLIPLKQYDIFIRIIKLLAVTMPGIKAVICGDGPEAEPLKNMITEYGLEKNIELCGEVRHEEVLEIMKRTKILLHPSSYEGFATVFSEALFAGAHVVSFCRPMNTLFDHQHHVSNEEEMLNAVKSILENTSNDHSPVITYPIEDTCKKMLSIFSK